MHRLEKGFSRELIKLKQQRQVLCQEKSTFSTSSDYQLNLGLIPINTSANILILFIHLKLFTHVRACKSMTLYYKHSK